MTIIHQKRPVRAKLIAAFSAGALALSGFIAASGPAVAHDGVDHSTEPGSNEALTWANYEKITLTKDVGEPLDMAILPDGRILHTARNGDVRMTDPASGVTKIVASIPVYTNSEDGLQGIGIDPDFAENGWVYVVYAPLSGTPSGSAPTTLPAGQDLSYWDQWKGVNRLSRFQWTGQGLDLASEQKIIDVETQRGQCCHVGADFDWDGDGNLYLSTGDNTPASAPGANGFAPNNDAPGMNPGLDSRRGSGNTNDLRGKILRITVQADGTYTIPEGNLFPVGTEKTRPEIFVMGVRNPFRIDVDAQTNSLSWGDYGPDAANADAQRGPMGYVEWNVVSLDDPHNSGWPYVHGPNAAYNEWNYATSTPGAFFDPAALKNNSRWNTGLVDLPPARAATLYYGDRPGDQPRDELVNFGTGSGQGPMGGPVYHYDATNPSTSKLPEYWDGKAFFGEFSQDYLAAFTVNWDSFDVTHIENFTPNASLQANAQPLNDNVMDIEFGPDGSLYVLDYGDGFFRANPDSGLYRIDYAVGNKAPQARFTATPVSSSQAPLEVTFDASASTDPENSTLTYDWDFNGDGTFDATGVQASHTYTTLGKHTARLRVTDPQGKRALVSKSISVGNQTPVVTVDYPADGAFFSWGDAIPFKVSTQDAEDGAATVCSRVAWTLGLGHDEHAHPEVSGTGCTGAWKTSADSVEHGDGAHIYGAVVVTYTDGGHNGLPAASSDTTVQLNPFLQQAEHAGTQGVIVFDDETASAGKAVRGLGTGDYLRYDPVNLAGVNGVVVRANGGGQVQLRWGAADAAPFATAQVPTGAGWKDVTVAFANPPQGTGTIYVTSAAELAVDSLTFTGAGAGDRTPPTVTPTLSPATPTGVGGVYNRAVALGLAVRDDGAIASVQYSANNGQSWTTVNASGGAYTVNFTTNGARTLLYRATDTGGNVSTVGTVSFTIDLAALNQPTVASTTTAVVDEGRVSYGAPGSVTVTVTGAGGTPSGEIVLTSGAVEVGRGPLADGTATIALDPALGVGTHTITASYGADQVFLASKGTVRLTVAAATSTLTATVSPNPVKPAIAPKATVNVTTSTGVMPTGAVTVTVKRNNATVSTSTGILDGTGAVVVPLPKIPLVGTYKVELTYAGTTGITKSATSLTLTVRN